MKFTTTFTSAILAFAAGYVNAAPATADVGLTEHPAGTTPNPAGALGGGYATWYYQYGVAGSCGEYHQDGEYLCAVSPGLIGGHCGRPCHVSYGGREIWGRVVDTCMGCGNNHVDLSVGAFNYLSGGNLGQGVLGGIDWFIG